MGQAKIRAKHGYKGRTKEVSLDFTLGLVQRVRQHLGLDGQVLNLEDRHEPLDAIPPKDAEETVAHHTINQTTLHICDSELLNWSCKTPHPLPCALPALQIPYFSHSMGV
jgi:hypothetical protein